MGGLARRPSRINFGRRPPAPRSEAGGLPAACGDAQVRAGAAPRRGEGKGRQKEEEEEEEEEGVARKVAQEARFPWKRQGRAGSDGGETAAGTGGGIWHLVHPFGLLCASLRGKAQGGIGQVLVWRGAVGVLVVRLVLRTV